MQNLNLKKIFLYLLIVSVALSALLGIGVILFGNFGEFETKILLTAFTITVTSILGLACGAYLETKRGKFLPTTGIIFALLSAILWIVLIWNSTIHEDLFAKTLMSVTLLVAACSLLSLNSMARLDKRFLWSFYVLHFSVWALSAILLWFIWFTPAATPEFFVRTTGVLSVTVAALTIVTPIFHKLSRGQTDAPQIDAEIAELEAQIVELKKQREEILK